jgi:predicted nucleic acid-binding protein
LADPFVDTDIVIRLLTGDDPVKQAQAASLFRVVEQGERSLAAPDTVIADAVHVLASPRLYHLPRGEVGALLVLLLRLPGFKVENKRAVIKVLEIFSNTKLDFGDALIVATMQLSGSKTLFAYESDFDAVAGIERLTPAATPQ